MRIIKKILWWYLASFLLISSRVFAQSIDFYYKGVEKDSATTDIAHDITKTAVETDDSLLAQLTEMFIPSYANYWSGTSRAIYYVKWMVNTWLGLVSLISLILVIYGFYLMFFSEDEEGLWKAKKILKGVAIALTIMGLSWLIVSFLFNTQQTLIPN